LIQTSIQSKITIQLKSVQKIKESLRSKKRNQNNLTFPILIIQFLKLLNHNQIKILIMIIDQLIKENRATSIAPEEFSLRTPLETIPLLLSSRRKWLTIKLEHLMKMEMRNLLKKNLNLLSLLLQMILQFEETKMNQFKEAMIMKMMMKKSKSKNKLIFL
jgi:hypothetical protein